LNKIIIAVINLSVSISLYYVYGYYIQKIVQLSIERRHRCRFERIGSQKNMPGKFAGAKRLKYYSQSIVFPVTGV